MGLVLRIQWIAFALFVGASLFMHEKLVDTVPVETYALQSALSRGFFLGWACWLVWWTFGPGRLSPKPQQWLFLDPTIAWLVNIPSLGSIALTWAYADDNALLIFVVFHTLGVAVSALGSARLPPSRGFGSPVPLVSPVALTLFFLIHPKPFSGIIILWLGSITVVLLYGRWSIERLLNQTYAANCEVEQALARVAGERDAKTRFLASASHDLAYPLQAARLFVDQIERQPPGAARDKAARNARWAFETTEHLLHQMINHLRLEAGRETAQIARIPLGLTIARVAELTEPAARLAGVELIALPSHLPVFADPNFLERALSNLVGNALRHAKAGRVLIGARRQGQRVRLWVIDDGVGIAPVDIATLFDDYVQGSDHGDEVRGGFGLGLASTKRMAELMGGAVGLDPNWRHGSAFWLELPVG